MVLAQGLEKSFGNFKAVRGVDFKILPGECFGLLGPNGAGKSTIINMIYGACRRTGGTLEVLKQDPNTQAASIKSRLGVVTQENALDESLTVTENMEIYASFVGVPKAQRKTRVAELLDYMNLSHKAHGPIRFLSGGMKRRLVFVRALLGNPDLIILDEPTTGLDPAVRHLIWGKVRELKSQGKTVLLTTHYMHEAEVLCDRLLIVNQGSVIGGGTPQELIKEHTPGYVAAFEKGTHLPHHNFIQTEDSSGIYLRAPTLEDLLSYQKGAGLTALQLRPANLEDVFLKLTGQELTADA